MNIIHGDPLNLGVTKTEKGYNFAIRSFTDKLTLEIYRNGQEGYESAPEITVNLDKSYKFGDIFSVLITGVNLKDCCYRYMYDARQVHDHYAKTISGCRRFGEKDRKTKYLARVELEEFDWGDDEHPNTPIDESILYKLHVRGFTKSRTSGVTSEKRGTFAGITEKIPYLKEIGITAVELMPAYEFDDARRFENVEDDAAFQRYSYQEGKHKVNYWGYAGGGHFAPKSAYCVQPSPDEKHFRKYSDYSVEFKSMVKELHLNGIEVIMEMYFTPDESYMISDCIRYWVSEYHIDGIHIYCDESALCTVINDPYLGNTKILTMYWNGKPSANGIKHIANYNTGFDETAKRLLKGDENQLQDFTRNTKANPPQSANINYVTNHNGFTMMDLVSYDRKHNEQNGEDNRDGENFNYSWNCGVEGLSKKKKINELRLGQIKNAFMMLLMAQGTPLILAGDEFGNSQSGNNNPYCIDNETTWLEWKTTVMASEIREFVKMLISFRKEHPILRMPKELMASDGISCGYPDISYHGDSAWFSRMESFERHIGIMYCEKYVQNDSRDELIYIAYNLHWEPHEMALPDIPEGNSWQIALSTAKLSGGINERKFMAMPRSITILTGNIKESKDKDVKKKIKTKAGANKKK